MLDQKKAALEPCMQSETNDEMVASLLDMIGASWMSQAICVAAELQLPDLLKEKPQTSEELAAQTQCAPTTLHRLLRALATLGICVERIDGSFALTPKGALLCSGNPSLRSWAIWWGKHLWPVWQDLRSSIRSGKSVRDLTTGGKGYSHLENDPERALIFNRAMAEMTQFIAEEILRVYDFRGVQRIVDVGGGYGELLGAILAAYPMTRGVLFDRPHAVNGAQKQMAEKGVSSRCDFVSGDFFQTVPDWADMYLLKSILHNWSDERAAVILQNCSRAMVKESKLLIIERVMPQFMTDTMHQRGLARTDLNMLVGLGGRERTEAQYRTLLAGANLELTRVVGTRTELSIMEVTLTC